MKKTVMLKDLAYARSGDKGDIINIGLMAFNSENYKILKEKITPEKIKAHFKSDVKGDVIIYDMPNLDSLEIVMHNALGGGATRTLALDQTGKAKGQSLLYMEIDVE
jgi:hypothetical protein